MDDVLLAEIRRKKQELQEKQVLVYNAFSDCSAELSWSIELSCGRGGLLAVCTNLYINT